MAATAAADARVTGIRAWLLLWRSAKALEALARRSVESSGLCLSDFGVLESLLHRGPLPVSELGRRVFLTSGSITTSIDRLERAGLVARTTTSADRRARIVHLTDAGRALISDRFAQHEGDMERAFAALSNDEIAALDGILLKLWRTAARPGATPAADASDGPAA
jgi:MarR family 2-MHQ and catechol resistance regulon transcriptional repressor